MDYGFTHQGKVFTPNGTADVSPADNEARNKAIELGELTYWASKPERMLAYYHFPAEQLPLFGRTRPYRASFAPLLHTYVQNGLDHIATVSTWLGTPLGTITTAWVYEHNFGGRFVSIRVKGTNGAEYHGRASYDWGQCINLRKVKG